MIEPYPALVPVTVSQVTEERRCLTAARLYCMAVTLCCVLAAKAGAGTWVPTLSGESIETFSSRVANSWGVGYKNLDNGILVTLAMKEQAVRIELGKGMERYISDAKAKSIIESSMTPAFAKGDFAGGLESGLDKLMQEARRFVVKATDLPGGAVVH
jgi:uncharacterized protein